MKETAGEGSQSEPIILTKTLMNQYRESLLSRGCRQQTTKIYFCYLGRLYDFLPENKEMTDEAIEQWIESLRLKGYSDRTINMHLSSVNGLLRYCDHKRAPIPFLSVSRSSRTAELTRDEYLQLLSHTKECHSEQIYLLIKVLVTIDINMTDLSMLTVEACKKGKIEFWNHKETGLPECVQKELLSYCKRSGIEEGPVFITRSGRPLDRCNVTHTINHLGEEAGLDPRKCNPSSLHRLYQRTQEEIDESLMGLHLQAYDYLLNTEQSKVAWTA